MDRVFCIANHPLNPHEFVSSGWDNTLQVQVKLGFKELLNKEHIGNSEPFPMTYLPVYSINSANLALVNNSEMTKKFLNAKFDFISF